jgi:hypothetical protein
MDIHGDHQTTAALLPGKDLPERMLGVWVAHVNGLDSVEKKIMGRLVESNPLTSLVAQRLVTKLTELLVNNNNACVSCR